MASCILQFETFEERSETIEQFISIAEVSQLHCMVYTDNVHFSLSLSLSLALF